MSKVLTILALSLGVATAANAGSSRPHYTYVTVNHQSQTNATSETVTAAPEIESGQRHQRLDAAGGHWPSYVVSCR